MEDLVTLGAELKASGLDLEAFLAKKDAEELLEANPFPEEEENLDDNEDDGDEDGLDDEAADVIGVVVGSIIHRGGIRSAFWESMEKPSQDTSALGSIFSTGRFGSC